MPMTTVVYGNRRRTPGVLATSAIPENKSWTACRSERPDIWSPIWARRVAKSLSALRTPTNNAKAITNVALLSNSADLAPINHTARAPIPGPMVIDTAWIIRRRATTCCRSPSAWPGISASNEGLSAMPNALAETPKATARSSGSTAKAKTRRVQRTR